MIIICSICKMSFETNSAKRLNRVCKEASCQAIRRKDANRKRYGGPRTKLVCAFCEMRFTPRGNNIKVPVCPKAACRSLRKRQLTKSRDWKGDYSRRQAAKSTPPSTEIDCCKPKLTDFGIPGCEETNRKFFFALLKYAKMHPEADVSDESS